MSFDRLTNFAAKSLLCIVCYDSLFGPTSSARVVYCGRFVDTGLLPEQTV